MAIAKKPMTWRKSSFSSNGLNCVEVAATQNTMLIRDSKNDTGPVIGFSEGEWSSFLRGIRSGALDLR
jgi:Domain of unknown function (DUF397)